MGKFFNSKESILNEKLTKENEKQILQSLVLDKKINEFSINQVLDQLKNIQPLPDKNIKKFETLLTQKITKYVNLTQVNQDKFLFCSDTLSNLQEFEVNKKSLNLCIQKNIQYYKIVKTFKQID